MRRVKNYNKNDFETLVKPANRPAKIWFKQIKWISQIKVYIYIYVGYFAHDSFLLESTVKPLCVKL